MEGGVKIKDATVINRGVIQNTDKFPISRLGNSAPGYISGSEITKLNQQILNDTLTSTQVKSIAITVLATQKYIYNIDLYVTDNSAPSPVENMFEMKIKHNFGDVGGIVFDQGWYPDDTSPSPLLSYEKTTLSTNNIMFLQFTNNVLQPLTLTFYIY